MIFTIIWNKYSVITVLYGTGTTFILICALWRGMRQDEFVVKLDCILIFPWGFWTKLRIHLNQDIQCRFWDLSLGATEFATRVKITASSYATLG